MRSTVVFLMVLLLGWSVDTALAQPMIDHLNTPLITGYYAATQLDQQWQGFVPVTGGTNFTWDYSNLDTGSPGSQLLQTVHVDSFLPIGTLPNAQVAVIPSPIDFSHAEFYSQDASGFYDHGISSIGLQSYLYDEDPVKLLSYPANIGEQWVDSFAGTWGSGMTPTQGRTQAEIGGYGTLILPGGLVSDVVRVLNYMEQEVYSASGTGIILTERVDFWKEGFALPIATFISSSYTNAQGSTLTDQHAFFTNPSNVGIDDARGEQALTVYPNPAHVGRPIFIKDLPALGAEVTLQLYDLNGRVIREVRADISGSAIIGTGELEPGAYILMMQHEGLNNVGSRIIIQQ